MFNCNSDNNLYIGVGYILKNAKLYKIFIAEGLSAAGYILSPELPGKGRFLAMHSVFFPLGKEGWGEPNRAFHDITFQSFLVHLRST